MLGYVVAQMELGAASWARRARQGRLELRASSGTYSASRYTSDELGNWLLRKQEKAELIALLTQIT